MGDKSAFVGGMKLGKLCTLFTDGDWIESKDQSDSGIRLIQTGNIGNGEFLYKNDKAKYISVDTFKRLNCKEVFPNDILVSRLPEPVGRGCIIPDIGESVKQKSIKTYKKKTNLKTSLNNLEKIE